MEKKGKERGKNREIQEKGINWQMGLNTKDFANLPFRDESNIFRLFIILNFQILILKGRMFLCLSVRHKQQ